MRDPTVNVATNMTTENVDKLSHPEMDLCYAKLSEVVSGAMVSHSLDPAARGIVIEKLSEEEVRILWSRMPLTKEYDNYAFMRSLLKKVKDGDVDLKNYEIKNAKLSKGVASLSVNVMNKTKIEKIQIRKTI